MGEQPRPLRSLVRFGKGHILETRVGRALRARQTLETFGYRVLTADDGAQAVGLFALNRTEIAVVITDIMMPVMDGTGLAAALHRLDPGVPMIAISGLNATVAPERLARVGIAHSLAKPFTTEALLRLLHKILVGRPTRPVPPAGGG